MQKILLLGAGRSASSLITYMLHACEKFDWFLTIGEISVELARRKLRNHPRGEAIFFDVHDKDLCEKLVKEADIVISLLPAFLHHHVAVACVQHKKNMVTASYVSPEMRQLDQSAKDADIIILNEIGLDPGIDHLSAKKIIDELHEKGAVLKEFLSYTGGLIAPEYDNNPWHYKFTWNPRNVVLAGQGTAKYIEKGEYKYVPYNRLFSTLIPLQFEELPAYTFEGYPNRDSLSYREAYEIATIPTLIRGTIRQKGFCAAWDIFVQLGMTDDTYKIENSDKMTYREFINAYLPNTKGSVEDKVRTFFGMDKQDERFTALQWLGIFEETPIQLLNATPAQILQHLLEEKWKLDAQDKDMIVMQHQFVYELNGKIEQIISSLVVFGEDAEETAMAKTVGYPLAIAAKMILLGEIKSKGVHIPLSKDIYEPILNELHEMGVVFKEYHKSLETV